VNNFIRTLFADCYVGGGVDPRPPTGVLYTGGSFFARMVRCHVQHPDTRGIHVNSAGYAHYFCNNHVQVHPELDEVDGGVGIETNAPRTIIIGGEYTAQKDEGGEGGTAILFNAERNERHGGVVIEPGIEKADTAVKIDGNYPFHGVQLYHIEVGYRRDPPAVERTVDFGNAKNCKLLYPVVWDRTGADFTGELVRWRPEATHCGVVTDVSTLQKATYTDEGATQPYVHLRGRASNAELSSIPTGVPTTLDYGTDVASPAFHDGQEWQRVASESFAPEQ
jgi:hypothetical protein